MSLKDVALKAADRAAGVREVADRAGMSELDALAADIKLEFASAERVLETGFQHAVRTGELLMQAKGIVPHGEWAGWLADKTQIPDAPSPNVHASGPSVRSLARIKSERYFAFDPNRFPRGPLGGETKSERYFAFTAQG